MKLQRLTTRLFTTILALLILAGLVVSASSRDTKASGGRNVHSAGFTVRSEDADGNAGDAADEDEDPESAAAHLVDASRGYSTKLYNNLSGLPTSEANAIAQTPEGFLWIGSYSGLVRYDGNTFERISSAETGITSVVSLFVDSKDRLWVGTNDGGAGVYDKGEWHLFDKQNGLKSLSVRSITEDENGLIYLATTEGVALVNENFEIKVPNAPQVRETYVRSIQLGPENIVYGLTIDGAVFTMKDGEMTGFYAPERLGVSGLHAILPDPDVPESYYCATEGSEVYYGTLGQPLTLLIDIAPLGYVNSINKFADEVWVCTDNGVGRIVDGGLIVLENLPMTTSIEGMMADYQNNLWFVSSQQGVMKIVPNRFSSLYEQYHLSEDVVYTTCLSGGKLFIGTKTSGLLVMENHQILQTLPVESVATASGQQYDCQDLIELLSDAKIRSIIRDSQGNVWFCSFGKYPLIRYDGKDAVVFTDEEGLPTKDRVRTIYECADGSYAVACTGGVAILEGDRVTRVYGEDDGINNTEVLSVVQTQRGDLLIGTDGDGIYAVSNGLIRHINTDNGLKSDIVMRIKKDRLRDMYWIVTSNSIAYMTGNYQVTTVKNFPYSNNFDIYQNDRDVMWVLSSNGIYVVPTQAMIDNADILPFFYGRENGLSCYATSNSYSELTAEGDLYISGSAGVVLTNINEENTIDSDVHITVPFIEADGEILYPGSDGTFVVPAGTRRVTVYAYCFNYSLVNPEITYQLEGFDRVTTTVRRSELAPLTYTNLSAGYYTFRMDLLDSRGQVQKTVAVQIMKKATLRESSWFRALIIIGVVLIVAAVTYLINKKRTAALVKKEHEQRILIREIVEAFAKVIDMKDKYTNGHSTRVAEYTAMLTRELGYDEETVEKYRNIALLHDIGKIGISSETLNKPGRLSDDEFREIKSHSGKGFNVLKDISIMPELAIGARDHHERPDGHGYPRGLVGDDIPRVAQIIAVADTFDAMYSDRPYRKRMNFDKAISIIKEVSGTQLTADVVDAFLRLVEKGEFRAEDDQGGGTFEDITNIHKAQDAAKKAQDEAAAKKTQDEADAAEALSDEAKAEAADPSDGKEADAAEAPDDAAKDEPK